MGSVELATVFSKLGGPQLDRAPDAMKRRALTAECVVRLQAVAKSHGGTFVKVVDEHTLAFADFSGNKQYISMGNLAENDKAFLFLMDYANRQRIKIWGRAEFGEDDWQLIESLTDPDYKGRPERALRFHVEAWDVNCPQHIPRMFSEQEVEARERALQDRIVELQAEVDRLSARA